MNKSLHVKVAKRENIPELCVLLEQLFCKEVEFTPCQELQEKALYKIINEKDVGVILVAFFEKKVIGMVNLLFTLSTALGDRVILLEDMIVDEDYRNEGVGSLLLEEAKKYAKENGFLRITLLSDDENKKAHTFYERHGFKDSPRRVFTCKF